jgi:hypothetical protein
MKFWIGVTIIAIAAALGWYGTQMASEGWSERRQKPQILAAALKVTVFNVMSLKFPGPLLFFYNSQLGKTMSPISIALYVEVVNSKGSITRIQDIKTKALMKYDEGGRASLLAVPSGGVNYIYTPSGITVEKWRQLYSVGFLHDQIYFIANNDWKKAKRIDFRKNSLETLAREKQLQPGESVIGWIFYELEEDLRGQIPEIKKIEFEITNSSGDVETIKVDLPKTSEESSIISSGGWDLQAGFDDLTKETYSLSPMIDLRKTLNSK